MANVDVRVQNGVKEHRHPGYPEHGKPQWHPVSQKHDKDLHGKYGITGKEKPNRNSPEEMAGVRRPGKDDVNPQKKPKTKKPSKQEETQERSAVGGAVSDVVDKWENKFKALAHQKVDRRTANPWVVLVSDALTPIIGFAKLIQQKMGEEDAKASLRGFDEAMTFFDESTALSDAKRMDQMSLSDLKRLDHDLMTQLNSKFKEYGGTELKGKKDRKSLQRKAELRAYRQIIDNLREQAQIKAEGMSGGRPKESQTRTRGGPRMTPTSSQGSGRKPSVQELRERQKKKKQTTE